MPESQNLKNHGRMDPLFHYSAIPILVANVIVTIVVAVQHGSHHLGMHIWLVVVSIALMIVATNSRIKDLVVQDRVIRLEERLRYAALLSPAALASSASLSIRQIVALRFASDSELSGLIARAVAENLTSKQIKESIVSWRADNHRV